MQAITFDHGEIQFHSDYRDPRPGPDEVRVRVLQAGVCETDLQLARGYMGFSGVPGHEFVGIAQAGKFAGQRVVGEINCNCRQCPRCQSGLGNHCDNRTVVGIDRHDGAFAQWVCIPEFNLHAVPDSISDDQAVFVEPLAAAFQIGTQVDFDRVHRAIILGDGRLGYLCAQAIAPHVKPLDIVGKHAAKLARFERLGLNTIALSDLRANKDYDLVVDCTGSVSGLPLALELTRPRGTVVLKTTVAAQHELSLAAIVIDEIQVLGSRCGPFDQAIEALEKGWVDVSSLITNRFSLKEADHAMQVAGGPDAFKVVFDVESA